MVRPATFSDIETIQHIAAITWPHAYAEVLNPKQVSYMLQMMYSTEVLTKQMEHEGHHFFIAEENGEAIGFAGCSTYEGTNWKLHKLYVKPFQQKSGTGRQLLQAVENLAKQHGATGLLLNVNRQNSAKLFYEKQGFYVAGSGDFDIGAGFYMNDYIMLKPL